MIGALLLKEWIKLRRLAWLAPLAVIAALVDCWLSLRGQVAAHGAAQLWNTLVAKRPILFDGLAVVLPLTGLWLAGLQFLPECSGRRLRLLFHLPIPPVWSLRLTVAVGLACLAVTLGLAVAGLALVLGVDLRLPVELAAPMLATLAPWGLAAMVAYLAAAAALADPSPLRKAALALAGLAHVALLTQTQGYGALSAALPFYGLMCLPWLLAPEAAALRVKEGD